MNTKIIICFIICLCIAQTTTALPIKIEGSRILTFLSKSIEGSKESYYSGTQREESMRLNISGIIDKTKINADFFSAGSISTTQTSTREEKVSILLKRGSTEAYMGDFTADLEDTEFTQLNLLLSGIRIKGNYAKYGFLALASNPKGFPKIKRFYGNGTQGPYPLDFSPVVVESERVFLNRKKQKRGDDYTIDYNAGTITFQKKTIISTSIVEVYYDYRKSVYQHALYALRCYIRPTRQLKIGATYINDSDTLQNAKGIRSATGINPAGHSVFGIDSSLLLGDNFSVESEIALSNKNYNLLGGGSQESGTALKTKIAGALGPFGIKANYKKINPGFITAAAANPKENLLNYGGLISFNPNHLFSSQLAYNHNKYMEAGINYEVRNQSFKISPLPYLEYKLTELENSNDPVSGAKISRITTKNRLLSNHQKLGLFNVSAKAERERRLNRYPSEEVTTYDIAAAGISTNSKLKKISAALNLEYKKTTEPGLAYSTKTYDLKLAANPSSQFLVSGSLHLVDDKKNGGSKVVNLIYKTRPNRIIGSDGKYTIQSVKETFGSAEASVTKQTGSFKFDLRPQKKLRLRYYFKPNYTLLDRGGQKIYNNENHQTEISYAFLPQAVIAYSYKTTDNFTIDKSDYPNLTRKRTTLFSNSSLYTIKAAPLNFLSTELNIITNNSNGTTLLSTSETFAPYRKDNTKSIEYNATAKTSLTRAFAIDVRYSHKTALAGTEESYKNSTNTIYQTGSIKGTWTINPRLRLSAGGYFTLSRNILLGSKTHTLSPSIGFIYSLSDLLRVDGEYNYSRSFSAIRSILDKFYIKGKYSLSEYLNLSLRFKRENNSNPFYRTTDFAGSVEFKI